MTAGGVDQKALLADLRKQVAALQDDLRERSEDVPEFASSLMGEYERARAAQRTAATYVAWREERITQAAVGWVLGCVFVRFCEDNGLIEWPFLAGPGERLAVAEERHEEFFRVNPQYNDRNWLEAAFEHLADAHPTAAGLFDRAHNPLWEITPSFEAASSLLAFWRRRGPDGEIVHDFTSDDWNTRFLGDLYQDLSEHARKTYALLQTPEFVEEFILDLTLEPAVEEFGLEPEVEVRDAGGRVERTLKGLRTIDPACGSGHFLLGIFHRLLDKWRAAAPGVDAWELIRRSLSSVHGCDKNPFAASIARFRLLVAAMKAGGSTRLDRAPTFPINVAVGDSLLHGRGVKGKQDDLFSAEEPHTYRTEDVTEFIKSCDLLTRSTYHVVVGNPPYITVKDKQENENYRDRYTACSGKYALSVPFAQCLFHLAIRKHGSERDAGFIGQITANSFMKREFGKKLIEEFFPSVDLSHVIDTSGACIPGHGTPTVILIGRNRIARQTDRIRAVLGVRGEPSQPEDPSQGLVWSAIVEQVDKPGSESEWISAEDSERIRFAPHPWSVSGGGALELSAELGRQFQKLVDVGADIGMTVLTLEDDVYLLPNSAVRRRNLQDMCVHLVSGDEIRDFLVCQPQYVLMPQLWSGAFRPLTWHAEQYVWAWRTNLKNRLYFGKIPEGRGLRWFDLGIFFNQRHRTSLSIAFAFVATHNHFVLDRGGKVFNRTAPVIKLPEGASEDDHLALLGVLNSSTACFWLKQVCHNKGNSVDSKGARTTSVPWEDFYEFTGTKLQEFPLSQELPLDFGQALDSLARRLAAQEPLVLCEAAVPTRASLDVARAEHERIRTRMIALQEELDWQVYGSYNLLSESEVAQLIVADLDAVPEIKLGERAFEIVLARKIETGEVETAWFARHDSTPITEIPAHWPEEYRRIVQARIDIIERRRDIALIERPECKRRWVTVPWEKREKEALRNWLLDRCEDPKLWFSLRDGMKQPRTLTVSQLADQLRTDEDVQSVAALYAADHLGKRDLALDQVLESIIAEEHVPYLAALRYKDSGLRKRAQWEQVWKLQREEDRTGTRLDIPVPPKYGSGDFRKTSYWSHRGKLDVPKERFISYPQASPDSDPTLLLGWAGWDHRDQAQALVNLVNDRIEQAGWDTARITPLLAGLAELMPWVRQWHGEYDAEWEGNPAEEYQAFLDEQRARHQLTTEALRAWRPAAIRGRKAAERA